MSDEKFWNCKYSEYDEYYDDDSSDVEEIYVCLKHNDCSDCENCNDFEEVR